MNFDGEFIGSIAGDLVDQFRVPRKNEAGDTTRARGASDAGQVHITSHRHAGDDQLLTGRREGPGFMP